MTLVSTKYLGKPVLVELLAVELPGVPGIRAAVLVGAYRAQELELGFPGCIVQVLPRGFAELAGRGASCFVTLHGGHLPYAAGRGCFSARVINFRKPIQRQPHELGFGEALLTGQLLQPGVLLSRYVELL